jgi:hypothetical protein
MNFLTAAMVPSEIRQEIERALASGAISEGQAKSLLLANQRPPTEMRIHPAAPATLSSAPAPPPAAVSTATLTERDREVLRVMEISEERYRRFLAVLEAERRGGDASSDGTRFTQR